MPTAATAAWSRTPPSVTMPAAPRDVGAQGEDVAERAGPGLAARLDDEHLALADGVERALLGVVAAAVPGEQVLAARHEPQGARGADELGARVHRPDAVDRSRRSRPRLRSCALSAATGARTSFVAQLGGEARTGPVRRRRASPTPRRAGRRRRRAASPSAPSNACSPWVTVVTSRPEVGAPAASGASTSTSTTSPGTTTEEPGGGAGEDDVARLEREVLREVGDELGEREQEPGGRVVLAGLAVDPGAHPQRRRVDRRGRRAGPARPG